MICWTTGIYGSVWRWAISRKWSVGKTWEKDDKSIGIGDAIFSDTSIWSISIFYTTMYFGNTIYIYRIINTYIYRDIGIYVYIYNIRWTIWGYVHSVESHGLISQSLGDSHSSSHGMTINRIPSFDNVIFGNIMGYIWDLMVYMVYRYHGFWGYIYIHIYHNMVIYGF